MTARNISTLSEKARLVLNRCSVTTPDELFRAEGVMSDPRLMLDDMNVGVEIVDWAGDGGVEFGPSKEGRELFDATTSLPEPVRQRVWQVVLKANPKHLGIEDVAARISPRNYREKFRDWAEQHRSYFGTPTLVGLSQRTRRPLQEAGLNSAEEIAACTAFEIRSISSLTGPMFNEVEGWLAGRKLTFAARNPWTANLSLKAQKALAQLNIRKPADLQKLRLANFVGLSIRDDTRVMDEIQQWAIAQGREIPK